LFFFFQAEDGIRDATVTGVQTCALPISYTARNSKRNGTRSLHAAEVLGGRGRVQRLRVQRARSIALGIPCSVGPHAFATSTLNRSEERRVGKGCRSGWSREQYISKAE